MTLNILFVTITIKRKKITEEEYLHLQEIERMMEENKNKYIQSGHFSRLI
ncbi:MAG TPA: YrzI family small protein [Niallia sp.]|nr:YrzI family small protein [Niallia sp.]